MVHPGYRKRTIFLLLMVLLVRFWYGQTFELSGQEAYLWLQGHGNNLSPAYWERGPMVPLLIRVGTAFFGDTELGVRWLAAVICCATGFVLFYLARHWFDARTAFWTVVLYLVIPMFAWKLSLMTEASAGIGLMALAMFGFDHAIETDRVRWWLLGGAACGMGLLVAPSYSLWLAGVVLYFATSAQRRARLREVRLWGALVFSALFLIPIIWWWHGAQVADEARQRFLNSWPLSHGFSLNQGFHFIGLEFFHLCPLVAIMLVIELWRMRAELTANPRYALLLWLAVPGLVWQNIIAFFGEPHPELVPALFLPLVLIVGCRLAQVTAHRRELRWLGGPVLVVALVQTLAGLNPFVFTAKPDGHGYTIRRLHSGESIGAVFSRARDVSWRQLAEGVRTLQAEQGATLLIADSPATASALSFYLPHNPLVYVEEQPGVVTHFDFWNSYAQNASPNDSALYIARSTNPDHPADPPLPAVAKDFASVAPVPDPPLPDFDTAWDIWTLQNFVGANTPSPAEGTATPMHESDALPTK